MMVFSGFNDMHIKCQSWSEIDMDISLLFSMKRLINRDKDKIPGNFSKHRDFYYFDSECYCKKCNIP